MKDDSNNTVILFYLENKEVNLRNKPVIIVYGKQIGDKRIEISIIEYSMDKKKIEINQNTLIKV